MRMEVAGKLLIYFAHLDNRSDNKQSFTWLSVASEYFFPIESGTYRPLVCDYLPPPYPQPNSHVLLPVAHYSFIFPYYPM